VQGFVAVTEDGEVAFCDWLPRDKPNQVDSEKTAQVVERIAKRHFGSCTAVERSPHFPEYYLTVGDWSFTIWKQGHAKPIFCSPMVPTHKDI
jgi:hypothetical protein